MRLPPLAIRIAASRLAARRTWTVSVLAAKLADERRRLDELQAGDLAVKATFELGYGQLEPAQARAFRLLGLADGPDISLAAAAAVLDLPTEETEDLLESLVDTSLLESAAPGRYRFHDLVRLYARACAERDEWPPSEREAAMSRLLDFYLATAARVYAIERPGDRTVVHLAPTSYKGLSFTGRTEALDWLFAEAQCLLACARQQTTGSGLGRAVDLLWAAKDLAESGANAKQYETAARALRDAAREDGDVRAESRARTALSNVHLAAGRYSEADEEARCAVELACTAGDAAPISWASTDRGIIALSQGRYEEAEKFLTTAKDGYRADGNRPGEANSLCNLSRLYERMNRTTEAVSLAQQGVHIFQQLGMTLRLANGRYALGVALIRAGRHSEGLEQLSDALEMFKSNRQRLWEGTTHFRIAQLHLTARRPAQAAQHAEQALAIGFIGGDLIRGSVLNTLGKSLNALGQSDRARACWQEALLLLEQSGAPEASEVRNLVAPVEAP